MNKVFSPIKVVLIDDDEDEVVLTEDLLNEVEAGNYQLDWCSNFNEGLESLLAGRHDIYLIDYHLGSQTGIELLKEAKNKGVGRAAIILTGWGDPKIDLLAMEMGASDYLVKGEFSSGELDRSIRYSIEHQRARDALALQAAILKNVHDAVFYVDSAGIILNWNDGASRIFEFSDATGLSILDICPYQGNHPFTQKIVPLVKKSGSAEEVMSCCLKSGKELVFRAKVTAMTQGGKTGYVICASDETKQRKLEAEILRVTENEQRRIGQDIHDELCSQLSGIGMLAKVLEDQLRRHNEKEAEMISNISLMVADAGQKARHIAKGLVPAALETLGLSGAIRELMEQNQKLFGVECVVTVLGESNLDSLAPGTCVQIYRITQEATTNALKHSDATLIQVRLTCEKSVVKLEIMDDGKGIPDDIISTGLGMMTMRQRAEMVGADFHLNSFAGKGTHIICNIPTRK